MATIKLNNDKLKVEETDNDKRPKKQPLKKRYTPKEKKLITDTIEATLLGMSTWLDSPDCIVKNEQGEVINVTVSAADEEAKLMYSYVELELQKKGIVIGI